MIPYPLFIPFQGLDHGLPVESNIDRQPQIPQKGLDPARLAAIKQPFLHQASVAKDLGVRKAKLLPHF